MIIKINAVSQACNFLRKIKYITFKLKHKKNKTIHINVINNLLTPGIKAKLILGQRPDYMYVISPDEH